MQSYKDNEILKAEEGKLSDLFKQGQKELESGFADSVIIGHTKVGDTFNQNNADFVVTEKLSRGRIKVKVKDMSKAKGRNRLFTINGLRYRIMKELGRGRYTCKLLGSA